MIHSFRAGVLIATLAGVDAGALRGQNADSAAVSSRPAPPPAVFSIGQPPIWRQQSHGAGHGVHRGRSLRRHVQLRPLPFVQQAADRGVQSRARRHWRHRRGIWERRRHRGCGVARDGHIADARDQRRSRLGCSTRPRQHHRELAERDPSRRHPRPRLHGARGLDSGTRADRTRRFYGTARSSRWRDARARRVTTVSLPDPPQPSAPAVASRDAVTQRLARDIESASTAIAAYSNLYTNSAIQAAHASSYCAAMDRSRTALEEMFGTVLDGTQRVIAARRARVAVLDRIIIPVDSVFGRAKRVDVDRLAGGATADFERWLSDSSGIATDKRPLAVSAFAAWLGAVTAPMRAIVERHARFAARLAADGSGAHLRPVRCAGSGGLADRPRGRSPVHGRQCADLHAQQRSHTRGRAVDPRGAAVSRVVDARVHGTRVVHARHRQRRLHGGGGCVPPRAHRGGAPLRQHRRDAALHDPARSVFL